MRQIKITGLIAIVTLLINCGPKLPDNYHMEKKYWAVDDYNAALRYMKYTLNEEQGYPRLSDPLTAPVFNKLIDKKNVSVVLEDESLGLKHRDNVADGFWKASKDIMNLYQVIDIQDKYVYPMEFVKAIDFFLHTQLLYFKIGNKKILKETVNPNDSNVKRIIKRNQQAIVDNFTNNLDILAKEDAFTTAALDELALVFDTHYNALITEYSNANYSSTKKTLRLLIDKTKSASIKQKLEKILTRLEN